MSDTKKLTLSALMTACAVVLVFLSKMFPAPWSQGGSITFASMVPIVAVSVMLGTKWGVLSSAVFSLIQLLSGFYPPPTQTFINFVLVIILDYIAAYGILGFAGFFYRIFGKNRFSATLAAFTVTVLRYLCHIISGVLIWGVYADRDSVLLYSIIYNGTYMLPEILITSSVTAAIWNFLKKYEM